MAGPERPNFGPTPRRCVRWHGDCRACAWRMAAIANKHGSRHNAATIGAHPGNAIGNGPALTSRGYIMAKAHRAELSWSEIDPASLPTAIGEAYAKYKAQYAAMKEARARFEDMLQPGAPAGKRIVCGYNFGKLSVALADAADKPASSKGSLSDFLSQQQAGGRRA